MADLHPDLLTVLEAAEILTATRYRVLDQVRDVLEPRSGGNADRVGLPFVAGIGPTGRPLLAALAADLYARLYIRPSTIGPELIDPLAERDLVNALSAANSGQDGWEPGWVVSQKNGEESRVAVTKEGLTFWAARDGVRAQSARLRMGQ